MPLFYRDKLCLEVEKVYSESLDIKMILKKIQEIDKLKAILLSDNQIYRFNRIVKPVLYLKEKSDLVKQKYRPNFELSQSGMTLELKDEKKMERNSIDERIDKLLKR